MSDNIELRDGQLLDLAYARALIGRMRAKYHERESDREAYNFAHLAETLYWQVVNTLEAVEEARDNAKVDAEAYLQDARESRAEVAAAREEGRRQGWAEAIGKARDLAAQMAAGWDLEPNPSPTYVAYGEAFQEAARRILALADQAPKG